MDEMFGNLTKTVIKTKNSLVFRGSFLIGILTIFASGAIIKEDGENLR